MVELDTADRISCWKCCFPTLSWTVVDSIAGVEEPSASEPRRLLAVVDSGSALYPTHWLSCGDLRDAAADAEPGCHDDGHLLSVSALAHDGMTSSDPELYSCASMSVIHTTQPGAAGQPPLVNGISLLSAVTSEM